jgi:hypothetical protein
MGSDALAWIGIVSIVNAFFVSGIRNSTLSFHTSIMLILNAILLACSLLVFLYLVSRVRRVFDHFALLAFGVLAASVLVVVDFHIRGDEGLANHHMSVSATSLPLTALGWAAAALIVFAWIVFTIVCIKQAMFLEFLDPKFEIRIYSVCI